MGAKTATMQTATVSTSPKVKNFLASFTTASNPAPEPVTTMPQPPKHRCPNCMAFLEPDEIKDQICWTCLGPLTQDKATDIDH